MRTLLVLPGMNTNPDPSTPFYLDKKGKDGKFLKNPHYSEFAEKAAILAATQGWDYQYLPGYQRITLRQGVAALRAKLTELADQEVVVVASSYGCWIALLAMSGDWSRFRRCPGHRLVLVNPYLDAWNTYNPLPRWKKLFSRTCGFPRKGENGKPGFWVPPWVVNSMLDPRNSLLSSRLYRFFNGKGYVALLNVITETSTYKPEDTQTVVANALGVTPEVVTADQVGMRVKSIFETLPTGVEDPSQFHPRNFRVVVGRN